MNFYNATYNFVKIGLITKTKPFLKSSTSRAIDLLSTKIILRDYRRNVLGIFNQKFKEEDFDTKEVFYKLDETDTRGLYSTIFVPECHYLGEALGDKTPNNKIESETEKFLEWFYNLATREHDERTTLNFASTNIRVGVILVAKLTTYETYGTTAYTKWAEKYASENYGAVYLLAKGKKRSVIAKEIARELVESKGFDQVNKNTELTLRTEDGSSILATCISLRPNIATIQYNAWEKLKNNFQSKHKVNGIIETVSENEVIVNIYGIRAAISNKLLSSVDIPNCQKLFKKDQELILAIEEFDYDKHNIVLSNIETETDPKLIVDSILHENSEINATMIRVQRGHANLQRGLLVHNNDLELHVFIPRPYATYSRFVDLEMYYKMDQTIKVRLIYFSLEYGNYIGAVVDLRDPWEQKNISKYRIDGTINAIVREITQNYLTCEIEDGLECRIYRSEYSWNEEESNSMQFRIEQEIKLKILNIDVERHQISGSIKQMVKSPNELFFEQNQNKVISGKITSITEGFGVSFKTDHSSVLGFVPLKELMWGFCRKISENFSVGDTINVRVIDYKGDSDSIWFSIKKCFENNFGDIVKNVNTGDIVKGRVINHFRDIVRVELNDNGLIAQAYIHKSEISNIAFLDENDLSRCLLKHNNYTFSIKRTDEKNEIIELSRKTFLSRNINELSYEAVISGRISKIVPDRIFFYSDRYEGFVMANNSVKNIGDLIDVYPIKLSNMEYGFAYELLYYII